MDPNKAGLKNILTVSMLFAALGLLILIAGLVDAGFFRRETGESLVNIYTVIGTVVFFIGMILFGVYLAGESIEHQSAAKRAVAKTALRLFNVMHIPERQAQPTRPAPENTGTARIPAPAPLPVFAPMPGQRTQVSGPMPPSPASFPGQFPREPGETGPAPVPAPDGTSPSQGTAAALPGPISGPGRAPTGAGDGPGDFHGDEARQPGGMGKMSVGTGEDEDEEDVYEDEIESVDRVLDDILGK